MVFNSELKKFYKNKKCLILGGTGFIGSNLAIELDKLGAKITVGYKNNKSSSTPNFNFVKVDILDPESLECLDSAELVFHFAGISGTVESNQNPILNLDVNGRGTLNILERIKEKNPNAIIFFPSSQQVYGNPMKLPVDEIDLPQPLNIYGANKLLVENYLKIYEHLYGTRSVILRLPNPYGPGQKADKSYGVMAKFINLAEKNERIKIYGKGEQRRDFIYIDDVVEAILIAMTDENCYGQVYNLGSIDPVSISDLVQSVVKIVGSGKVEYISWPKESKKAELGDIYLSYDKISKVTGWKPKTSLEEGIRLSI